MLSATTRNYYFSSSDTHAQFKTFQYDIVYKGAFCRKDLGAEIENPSSFTINVVSLENWLESTWCHSGTDAKLAWACKLLQWGNFLEATHKQKNLIAALPAFHLVCLHLFREKMWHKLNKITGGVHWSPAKQPPDTIHDLATMKFTVQS